MIFFFSKSQQPDLFNLLDEPDFDYVDNQMDI